ncbi:GrdX family protein [Haloimpatiens sp. FM7315]|uniref:GrdX family protein n=1 Tax=Haloimpatiens sp. FM7315 TaxID=3298609 RepID=UPI0035A3BD0A
MVDKMIIITNNPLAKEKLKEEENVIMVEFINGNVLEVFSKVRDYVHLGYELMTHPLMSSVKPNETPYRTVGVSTKKQDKLNMQSLMIIEGAIETTEKFLKIGKNPKWTDQILKDFQVIDYDLIYHVLN